MSGTDDPRCPECGEPIGTTATYCMHCSADLTGDRGPEPAGTGTGADDDVGDKMGGLLDDPTGVTDAIGGAGGDASAGGDADTGGSDGQLLDPEGFVDDTLTVLVGIAGGVVIGIVATVALLILTGGWPALLGIVAWLGSTAYLVRRRTVQGAISRTAYGVALALLLIPLIPLSPVVDASPGGRAVGFFTLLLAVGIPALVVAGVGYVASRFMPEESAGDATGAATGGGGAGRGAGAGAGTSSSTATAAGVPEDATAEGGDGSTDGGADGGSTGAGDAF